MGVANRRRPTQEGVDTMEDAFDLIEAHLEEPDAHLLEPEVPAVRSRPRRSVRRMRQPSVWSDHFQQRKRMGLKPANRLENLNHLLRLSEQDDLECELADVVEPKLSRFAELFMEQDKMKIWNDFINRSEEDQQHLLQHVPSSRRPLEVEKCTADSSGEESVSTDMDGAGDTWEVVDDNRDVHPAFSARDCFHRIDSNLKYLLGRRHVPKGTLAHLEEEVTSFFKEWPTSVFVSDLPNSYQRTLLHALCQYLDLTSRSFDVDEGGRRTQVENKHDFFSPPGQTLLQYLDQLHYH